MTITYTYIIFFLIVYIYLMWNGQYITKIVEAQTMIVEEKLAYILANSFIEKMEQDQEKVEAVQLFNDSYCININRYGVYGFGEYKSLNKIGSTLNWPITLSHNVDKVMILTENLINLYLHNNQKTDSALAKQFRIEIFGKE